MSTRRETAAALPARMPGNPAINLPGAARADAEQHLDRLAVEMAGVHAAEDVEDFRQSLKPCGF